MMLKIPHFQEVILMAFACQHCGFRSSELRPGTAVKEKALRIELTVRGAKDLDRQIVRSESCFFQLEALQLELPPGRDHGDLSTVEGVLAKAATNLEGSLPSYDEAMREKLIPYIEKVKLFAKGDESVLPFVVALDDPSGNSYIENELAPAEDPDLKVTHYERTLEQSRALGLASAFEDEDGDEGDSLKGAEVEHAPGQEVNGFVVKDEILMFPGHCPTCMAPCVQKMFATSLKYFTDIVVMAMNCDHCGFKSNEVKSQGAIEDKGRKYILTVEDEDDLNREILKSESAAMAIPEVELELRSGTLGGRFSTVEGLLKAIADHLEANPFVGGDSSEADVKKRQHDLIAQLRRYAKLENGEKFTMIVDDPLGLSRVQNIYAPDPDEGCEVIEYERSYDQNEDFGLNDIKTENYGEDAADAAADAPAAEAASGKAERDAAEDEVNDACT